ncbi:MAG: PadR family transcriptional regulator [Oscillospiraceae bacterium]|jgi:PadR family transcriptional regulator PadR|nr:PadR family transcriptional regulator [Oscillospiraceae bacterium]
MNVQLKKGVLELCVLALLNHKDCYGFELVSLVSSSVGMSEGTIYPLLKRLREEDLLTTYLRESTEGPPRKYYSITVTGRARGEEMLLAWKEFCAGVDMLLGAHSGGGNDGGDQPGAPESRREEQDV